MREEYAASKPGYKLREALTLVDNAIFALLADKSGDAEIDRCHFTLKDAVAAATEADEYIAKLEQYALDGDAYRCDGCERVFDCDEIIQGEDCHLCRPCAAILSQATSA